MIDPC